jgi:hypothetical protein
VNEPRQERWVRHVAGLGERRNAYIVLLENLRGGDCAESVGVDDRIILK